MKSFKIICIIAIILLTDHCHRPINAENNQKKQVSVLSYDKGWMNRIVKRNELQHEGYVLAKQGRYDEALEKYKLSMDPGLLNNEGDKSVSLCAIRDIYRHQGKFQEALNLNEKYILPRAPEKDSYIDANLELKALIRARDLNSDQPIYYYITYIKTKYEKYLPPKGYAVPYNSEINDLVNLYDYLHDYDDGIKFMDEIIKYHTQHPDKNHRLANAKNVREYTRVKQAWELDKKTGQHGHLQEVIRTSDVISW